MHVIFTILERSLILDEESLQLVEEELHANFPLRTAPRCAQRQIKLAFSNLVFSRVTAVLKELGKRLWNNSQTKQSSESWATSFCLLLLLTLAIDKTTVSAHYFCEGRIRFPGHDPKLERAAFGQMVTLIERELYERCKEIFHRKFKTRKAGKEACNPIRDGVAAFRSSAVPEPRTAKLVMDLQELVQDFGTYSSMEHKNRSSRLTIPEPHIRAHCSEIPQDSEYDRYTDAGRLTRIFLDDFLSH